MWRRQLKLGLEEIISYTFIFEKKMVLYFLACGILVPWPGIESLLPIMETLSFNPSVCVLVTQLCPTLCDPMDCSPPDSSVHGISQARILEWVCEVKVAQSCLTLRPHGLYSPWNSPGQNTRVGSLSHLQGIVPNQGLNPGLPHCRWIPYQLNHKGSPEWFCCCYCC